MRRRHLLVAVAGVASLSGCLAGRSPVDPTTTPSASAPRTRTAEGVTATFRVVDGRAPTDDTAAAVFDDGRVTVTGTADLPGCDRPVLAAVGFDPDDGVSRVVIGGESPYETADVECGNASFDHRCVASVDQGEPTAVAVIHAYGDEPERFLLERRATDAGG